MQRKYTTEAPAIKYLTLDDQINILNMLEEGASVDYLAQAYDRSTKTINRIRQLEPVIKRKYLNRNSVNAAKNTVARNITPRTRACRRIRGNDVTLMKVERVLNTWIQEKFREDILMSYAEIKRKALELFEVYRPKSPTGQQAVVFKASKSWLYRFKRRYHLTHLEKALPRDYEYGNQDGNDVIEIDDDDEEDCEYANGDDVYESLPSLWNVRSCIYSNRDKKQIAYDKLLVVYRTQYPNATKDDVKKKINSLRTNWRKELYKIEASKKRGKRKYTSSLWYFDSLKFLLPLTVIHKMSNESINLKSESSLLEPSTSGFSGKPKEYNESVYITDDDDDEAYLEGADEEEIDYKDLETEGAPAEVIEPLTVNLQKELPTKSIPQSLLAPPETIPANAKAKSKEYPSSLECDLFGEFVSKHLQELPLEVALKVQFGIHNLVMKTRLEYARQNPDDVQPMVKQEVRYDEEMEHAPKTSTKTPDKNADTRPHKRPLETEPPSPKRHKPTTKTTNTQSSQTTQPPVQQTKSKRSDCVVFAEQIAVQLEQLPEELVLQLQSDIYAMITQASPENTKDDPPEGIRIKTEVIEVSPTEIMNEYYDEN